MTQLLNGRQRVTAASLLKKRPALRPETCMLPDDAAYRLWSDLVCSEMQRLGVIDAGQIREFCERAGMSINEAIMLSAAPSTAA